MLLADAGTVTGFTNFLIMGVIVTVIILGTRLVLRHRVLSIPEEAKKLPLAKGIAHVVTHSLQKAEEEEEEFLPPLPMKDDEGAIPLQGAAPNLEILRQDEKYRETYLKYVFGCLVRIYGLSLKYGKIVRDGPQGMEGTGEFTHLEYLHLVGTMDAPGVLLQAHIAERIGMNKKSRLVLVHPQFDTACFAFEKWHLTGEILVTREDDEGEDMEDEMEEIYDD